MCSYFKNIALTKASTQEGYFKTGDIARYDSGGWIFIEGTISDLINVEGTNESPREIEEIILQHPYVKDTAVISDEKEVVACVIVKTDAKLDEDKLTKYFLKEFVGVLLNLENFQVYVGPKSFTHTGKDPFHVRFSYNSAWKNSTRFIKTGCSDHQN